MKDYILTVRHKCGKQSLTVQKDIDDILEQLTTYDDVSLVVIKKMEQETLDTMWAYPIYIGPAYDTAGMTHAVQYDEPLIFSKREEI